jgi:hypothetical protein
MCDPPCQNGGLCVKTAGLHTCACPAGWSGDTCSTPGSSNTRSGSSCTDWTTAACLPVWAQAPPTTAKVDCVLSPTQTNTSKCAAWSACGNEPTKYSQFQTRVIETPAQNGGQSCAAVAGSTPFCTTVPCNNSCPAATRTGVAEAPRLPAVCRSTGGGSLAGCAPLRAEASCAIGSDSPCALTNPCRQMDIAFRSNISGSGPYGTGCYPNGASGDMQRINCGTTAHAPENIEAGTSEERGIGNCNFEGPFCHLQASPTTSSCCNWAGGKSVNTYQGAPWPCYGYLSFLNRIHKAGPADTGLTQKQHDQLTKLLVAPGGGTIEGESVAGLSSTCSTYATTVQTNNCSKVNMCTQEEAQTAATCPTTDCTWATGACTVTAGKAPTSWLQCCTRSDCKTLEAMAHRLSHDMCNAFHGSLSSSDVMVGRSYTSPQTCTVPPFDAIKPRPSACKATASYLSPPANGCAAGIKGIFTYSSLMEAFDDAGYAPEFCPAMLRVVAGECQNPDTVQGFGCLVKDGETSGVMQLDSLKGTVTNELRVNGCVGLASCPTKTTAEACMADKSCLWWRSARYVTKPIADYMCEGGCTESAGCSNGDFPQEDVLTLAQVTGQTCANPTSVPKSQTGGTTCAPHVGGDTSCPWPAKWLKAHGLDGVAAVPPIMYGDWGAHGQGCSFTPSNGGLCYRLTKKGKDAKTVAIVGRCGGYSQCSITDDAVRQKGEQMYNRVSHNLALPNDQTVNVDGNYCMVANNPGSSRTVAGATPVCYALYAESTKDLISSARPCVCTGKEPAGFAGCDGSNHLKSCGPNKDQSCNVDWCASNLHPHFDLNQELIADWGIDGADYIDHVSPVPCPMGTLRPTAAGKSYNTCTGNETGEAVCTCRNMKRVSLGTYGSVCVPKLPCNQDPYTDGLASPVHSDRCPANVGKCVDSECQAHAGTDSWVAQNFGITAAPDLISTFPRPTVTEYCSLGSGGCGGWDVACHVPELECDPNASVFKKEGESCTQEDACLSKNCAWSKSGAVCGPPRDFTPCATSCGQTECTSRDAGVTSDQYYQKGLNDCLCNARSPAPAGTGISCCTGGTATCTPATTGGGSGTCPANAYSCGNTAPSQVADKCCCNYGWQAVKGACVKTPTPTGGGSGGSGSKCSWNCSGEMYIECGPAHGNPPTCPPSTSVQSDTVTDTTSRQSDMVTDTTSGQDDTPSCKGSWPSCASFKTEEQCKSDGIRFCQWK